MTYARIAGIGSYLPEKVVTNKDLEKMMDTSDEWIRERTGIKRRHIAVDGETTGSMGLEAAKHNWGSRTAPPSMSMQPAVAFCTASISQIGISTLEGQEKPWLSGLKPCHASRTGRIAARQCCSGMGQGRWFSRPAMNPA
jgi:hypothetical protein